MSPSTAGLVAAIAVVSIAPKHGLAGDLELPRESPAASVALTIGVTKVTVDYHRPALHGRDPWKDLGAAGSMGKVWRFGANEATRIAFDDAVTFGGEEVPAGEYGLFAIPAKDEWTVIVSRQARTWGAFAYDPRLDVARVDVAPGKGEAVDRLTFTIEPVSDRSAELRFAWSDARIAIPIEVDVDAAVKSRIDEALASLKPDDWDTRLAIAKYWVEHDSEIDRASQLADEALALQANWWTLEWKARILDKQGKRAEALPLLERALEVSRGKTPKGYQDGLERMLAEWKR